MMHGLTKLKFERIFAFERRVAFFSAACSYWWLGRDFFIANFKR